MREVKDVVVGRGRAEGSSKISGRRSSMNSSSGGRVRGEKSG